MFTRRKTPASNELNAKEIAALIEASNVSEEEIRRWHTDFLERHPSGQFDKQAFCEYYGKLCPNKETQTSFENIFDTIDVNNDGKLDFNELLVVIVLMSRLNALESRLAFAFDMFDGSGDGQIDREELTDVIKAIYDRAGVTDRKGERDPKKRAQSIIDKIDNTGNNKLSKAEFIKGCQDDPVIRSLLAPYV